MNLVKQYHSGLLAAVTLMALIPAGALAEEIRAGVKAAGTATVSSEGDTGTRNGFSTRNPRYLLRASDKLQIRFTLTPEFDQDVSVQPDGFITLRDAGDIHVAGETLPELRVVLLEKYSQFLHNPVMTVVLTEFESPYFIASGEFEQPGKFELRGTTTVTQAVALAGGFKDTSKRSQLLLFRQASEGWMKVQEINVKEMLDRADLSEDVVLRPGDMLFVPKSRMSKIKDWIPSVSLGAFLNPADL